MTPAASRQLLHLRLLSNATLLLLSEELPALSSNPSADSSVPSHCADCRRVVVLTLPSRHANPEQQARLRYQHIMHEKVWVAENAALRSGFDSSSALGRPAVPRADGSGIDASTLPAPFLRVQPDGRLALIVADFGGELLERSIVPPARFSSGAAAAADGRTLLVPIPSSSSVSSASLSRTSRQLEVPTPQPLHRQTFVTRQPPATSVTIDSLQRSLRVGLALATKLHTLHTHSLLHLSLHPATLLYHSGSGALQLLDLGSASVSRTERADSDAILHRSEAASRWLYLSPEQSGKANRLVDARSDLYSLGAIMFAIAAGRPPFTSDDTVELIHQHLARAPHTLLQVHQGALSTGQQQHADVSSDAAQLTFDALLHVLSVLVAKLLNKSAEDRYQSAAGLLFDLHAIAQLIQGCGKSSTDSSSLPLHHEVQPLSLDSVALGDLRSFQLSTRDANSSLRIAQKLYGREEEVATLLESFRQLVRSDKQIARGNAADAAPPQLLLVSGYSGIGKSSLCDELHKQLVRQRALFARGKFDLLKRDSSCLLKAFRQLLVQLHVCDATTWRVRLMHALGRNAGVLVHVLPELSQLLGEVPPPPPLNTTEAQQRFQRAFVDFVAALAPPQSPLALFIDDVQW